MGIIDSIITEKVAQVQHELIQQLYLKATARIAEAKFCFAQTMGDQMTESSVRKNPNIMRMGRIQKIRRRLRRNSKGMIVLQRNRRKSSVSGYRVSGNTVKRIPATVRIKKSRLLKRSWKTSRRAKLRRTLTKRLQTMRRRKSLGI